VGRRSALVQAFKAVEKHMWDSTVSGTGGTRTTP
jgi:hypothetical protein